MPLRTCNDLEEWVKKNAALTIDGTYQAAVFWFVANRFALDTSNYSRKDIARLFMNGISKMSEEIVNEWLNEFFEDELNEQANDEWDMDYAELPPAKQRKAVVLAENQLEEMLTEWFTVVYTK